MLFSRYNHGLNNMNIYFACSITGGRDDQHIYQAIVNALLDDDHDVPTAILATPQAMMLEGIIEPDEVYRRDVNWINGCDLLIAEVSTPSHGVGYEIGHALSLNKPVLCLYRQGVKVSKMILGNLDENLIVRAYQNPDEAVSIMRTTLRELTEG